MNLLAILSNIRFPDIIDILLISVVAYQLYNWFSGTKAFKALIGIVLLSGVFIMANSWGLFLTSWVFQILWQVFVILLIILFQREIRQMLERFNPLKQMGFKQNATANEWIENFSKWAFDTAKEKIGAVIVFERRDLVFDLITKGISMESDPLPEILSSVFYKTSPLHDGAAVISNGKILKTACYLPLCTREDLPSKWGTRHRAALGLSEQCDAWVMIISEERGEVSMAMDQEIKKIDNQDDLTTLLQKEMFRARMPTTDINKIFRSWIVTKYQVKFAVFALVFVLWLVLAGQQNFEKKMQLPLTLKNIPESLQVTQPADPVISVIVRGLRKDVSVLNIDNINSFLDLYGARKGVSYFTVTAGNVVLPNDRVHVADVTPSKLEFLFEEKSAEPVKLSD